MVQIFFILLVLEKCLEIHLNKGNMFSVSRHNTAFLFYQVMSAEVGDWRKNVEAMSGMEGRKKMFDAAGGGQ